MLYPRERLIKATVVGVATPLPTLASAQELEDSLRPGSRLLAQERTFRCLRVHGWPGSRALDMLYA